MRELANQSRTKSPAFQRARLASFPANLYKSRNLARYCQVLTDFIFLEAKIKHPEFGVEALIEDYELMNSDAEGLNQGEYASQKKSLKLLQGALRLSAHILSQDKTQLAEQLLGRMQGIDLPEIQQLLAQAKEKKTIWLRPVTTSLTPPGGKLLRTLSGHRGSVNAVALSADGQQAISASDDNTLKVWDLSSGKAIATFVGDSPMYCCAIAPDGVTIVAGEASGQLHFLRLEGMEVSS